MNTSVMHQSSKCPHSAGPRPMVLAFRQQTPGLRHRPVSHTLDLRRAQTLPHQVDAVKCCPARLLVGHVLRGSLPERTQHGASPMRSGTVTCASQHLRSCMNACRGSCCLLLLPPLGGPPPPPPPCLAWVCSSPRGPLTGCATRPSWCSSSLILTQMVCVRVCACANDSKFAGLTPLVCVHV